MTAAAPYSQRMRARSKFVVSWNQASIRLSLISGLELKGSFRFPSARRMEMLSMNTATALR